MRIKRVMAVSINLIDVNVARCFSPRAEPEPPSPSDARVQFLVRGKCSGIMHIPDRQVLLVCYPLSLLETY